MCRRLDRRPTKAYNIVFLMYNKNPMCAENSRGLTKEYRIQLLLCFARQTFAEFDFLRLKITQCADESTDTRQKHTKI